MFPTPRGVDPLGLYTTLSGSNRKAFYYKISKCKIMAEEKNQLIKDGGDPDRSPSTVTDAERKRAAAFFKRIQKKLQG
jgi:hypothetical protein